jgi:raffinose/stachyose/melibiose transport system substrate-binding protein
MTENFESILDEDGLAFYPDWPVPGAPPREELL